METSQRQMLSMRMFSSLYQGLSSLIMNTVAANL